MWGLTKFLTGLDEDEDLIDEDEDVNVKRKK